MFFFSVLWQTMVLALDVGFDITPMNVTAIKGQPAILPCTVLNKLDKQVTVQLLARKIYSLFIFVRLQ